MMSWTTLGGLAVRAKTLIFAACFLSISTVARAQVLLEPVPQGANQNRECGSFANPSTPLTELRDHYTSGRWDSLQADTRTLLESCAFAVAVKTDDPALFVAVTDPQTKVPRYMPDYKRDWYLIVLATVDRDDQPLVIRYLLHEPLPYPYTSHTVGVPSELRDVKGSKENDPVTPRLVQVFLAPNKSLTLDTRIQVTETADPLKDQIADFVKAVFDPAAVIPLLKGIIAPANGAAGAARVEPRPVVASVSRIFPPYDRADYKYTDVIRAPATLDEDKSLLLRDKFDTQVDAALKLSEAADKAAADTAKSEADIRANPASTPAEKARAMARRDAAAAIAAARLRELELARELGKAANTYLRDQQTKDCSAAAFKNSCWTGLTAALTTAIETFCLSLELCPGDRENLMLLKFKEVSQPPKTVTTSASTTLSGIPYQRLSFGTLGGYIAGATSSKDRVKVDGGKVVNDPIGRALTAVVLNFHPRFDPKAPEMESGERWRAFVGGVLTPNLGMTLGGGYAFLRNLSINVGYALLVIPTMRDIDTINAAPTDGTRPFRAGGAHVGFLGFGYKFGK